jgi:sugar phosphate isomerase/epimerase
VTSHVVSTPEKMRRLLDEIASPCLKVVFDPVNLLNLHNFTFQCEVVRRSLELFGEDIIVVHAKDFRVAGDSYETCPAGSGMLDYDAFLPWFARHKPGITVLLEEAGPEAAAGCRHSLIQSIRSTIP